MAVEMIQLNSREEWLEHRKKYIGGSEAAAIVGMNPYCDNVTLWKIKTGQIQAEDISDKPQVQFGVKAEPIIRELFQLNYPQYKMVYVENNSFLNKDFPFAAASLDGLLIDKETGRLGIWECKTSEIVSSMHKEKWNNKVPDNYYIQLLHYLMVHTDCEFAHLTALLTFKYGEREVFQQLRNYHIEREDVKEDIYFLSSAELRFWHNVQLKRKPDLILPPL